MIHQAQWAGMSVGAFFQGYNWQGTAPVLTPTVTDEEASAHLPSLLCLSVAAFLQRGNWTGQRRSPVVESQTPVQTPVPPPVLSLTASVGEFCRGINWSGGSVFVPPVSAPPAMTPPPPSPAPAKTEPHLGLDDLSELF